jgi:hypothetical protein
VSRTKWIAPWIMAELLATRSSRGHRTICLPIAEETYRQIVGSPSEFRRAIDDCFRQRPELFPADVAHGYQLKDKRRSAKQGLLIRRIVTSDGTAYSIRPSFLMPYLTARTEDVEGPLFLRKFGVPSWALARVFGGNAMSWYRRECALGRFSVAGTTVRQAEVPEHLLADEHHQALDGQKVYSATTVSGGCILGAEPARTASADDLKAAYGVFKEEARDLAPEYAPVTVSTDGWKGTRAAWKALFPHVVPFSCASCTRGSRSGTGPSTSRRCSRRSRGGFGRRITRPIAGASGNGCAGSGSGPPTTSRG